MDHDIYTQAQLACIYTITDTFFQQTQVIEFPTYDDSEIYCFALTAWKRE